MNILKLSTFCFVKTLWNEYRILKAVRGVKASRLINTLSPLCSSLVGLLFAVVCHRPLYTMCRLQVWNINASRSSLFQSVIQRNDGLKGIIPKPNFRAFFQPSLFFCKLCLVLAAVIPASCDFVFYNNFVFYNKVFSEYECIISLISCLWYRTGALLYLLHYFTWYKLYTTLYTLYHRPTWRVA